MKASLTVRADLLDAKPFRGTVDRFSSRRTPAISRHNKAGFRLRPQGCPREAVLNRYLDVVTEIPEPGLGVIHERIVPDTDLDGNETDVTTSWRSNSTSGPIAS